MLELELLNPLRAQLAMGVTSVLGLPTGLQALVDLIAPNANGSINSLIASLSDPNKVEAHGIVFDARSGRLDGQGAAGDEHQPGALPAVDPDYDGPVSDYLGSGPRVIRLVR